MQQRTDARGGRRPARAPPSRRVRAPAAVRPVGACPLRAARGSSGRARHAARGRCGRPFGQPAAAAAAARPPRKRTSAPQQPAAHRPRHGAAGGADRARAGLRVPAAGLPDQQAEIARTEAAQADQRERIGEAVAAGGEVGRPGVHRDRRRVAASTCVRPGELLLLIHDDRDLTTDPGAGRRPGDPRRRETWYDTLWSSIQAADERDRSRRRDRPARVVIRGRRPGPPVRATGRAGTDGDATVVPPPEPAAELVPPPVREPATEADLAVVAAQLGRTPRGTRGGGAPLPVRPARTWWRPRRGCADGTPFPTLYYLTCPRATAACSRLESAGLMREMAARLADRPGAGRRATGAAHEDYLARREAIGEVPEIAGHLGRRHAGAGSSACTCTSGTRWPPGPGSTRSATRRWRWSSRGGSPARAPRSRCGGAGRRRGAARRTRRRQPTRRRSRR